MWLRQRDGVTCGPSVAVMAGALLDDDYGAALKKETAQQWFAAEQGRVHRATNRVWPRALGTTPAGMARALTAHGRRYRWRPAVGHGVDDVCAAVKAGFPVAMLIGNALPRHWVLLTEVDGQKVRCYEPGRGQLVDVTVRDIREARLKRLGYPRAYAFVLPG